MSNIEETKGTIESIVSDAHAGYTGIYDFAQRRANLGSLLLQAAEDLNQIKALIEPYVGLLAGHDTEFPAQLAGRVDALESNNPHALAAQGAFNHAGNALYEDSGVITANTLQKIIIQMSAVADIALRNGEAIAAAGIDNQESPARQAQMHCQDGMNELWRYHNQI